MLGFEFAARPVERSALAQLRPERRPGRGIARTQVGQDVVELALDNNEVDERILKENAQTPLRRVRYHAADSDDDPAASKTEGEARGGYSGSPPRS
jgi:hypothetical protein